MTNSCDIAHYTFEKLFPKRMDDHLFISYTFLQQKKKNFLSVRDKFFSHIKCVSFSLSTSAKYICLDTLRHYALLLNSSHEPFAIYMNSNNRKKCLRWKWNCILNYHDHNDGEIIQFHTKNSMRFLNTITYFLFRL